MLVLTIKWLLPLVAIGFLAGAMFRLRYQVVAALALAAGCAYYFLKQIRGGDPGADYGAEHSTVHRRLRQRRRVWPLRPKRSQGSPGHDHAVGTDCRLFPVHHQHVFHLVHATNFCPCRREFLHFPWQGFNKACHFKHLGNRPRTCFKNHLVKTDSQHETLVLDPIRNAGARSRPFRIDLEDGK